MKYTVEIEIDRPIEKVIELFDNPDNLQKWMKGLLSMEHVSGTPGEPGAKSLLRFKMGNKEIEMTETIITRSLPEEFTATYEAKGVHNIVANRFLKLSEHKTKYSTEQEFEFSGFMKMVAFLMPGVFKKQSMDFLKDFKEFVESQP
jgi:uncharacterized membrane protein